MPTLQPEQLIMSLITLAGSVFAGWVALKSNREKLRQEATAVPYSELTRRVAQLEQQVASALTELWWRRNRDAQWTFFHTDLHDRWSFYRTRDEAPTFAHLTDQPPAQPAPQGDPK